MAITRGNTFTDTLGATPNSTTFDSGTGSDRCLVVLTHATAGYATGCTYNGVAMTRGVDFVDTTPDYYGTLWYLFNPATGSNTFTATAASGSIGSQGLILNDTDTTATPATDGSATVGNAVSLSSNATAAVADSWVVAGGRFQSGATSFSAGATQISSLNSMIFGDSNGTVAAGSTTVTTATTVSSLGSNGMIIIAPPAGGGGPANLKTWDGLAKASIKTIDGLAIASIKTWNGLN